MATNPMFPLLNMSAKFAGHSGGWPHARGRGFWACFWVGWVAANIVALPVIAVVVLLAVI